MPGLGKLKTILVIPTLTYFPTRPNIKCLTCLFPFLRWNVSMGHSNLNFGCECECVCVRERARLCVQAHNCYSLTHLQPTNYKNDQPTKETADTQIICH
jgi:hypothetical protein